MRYSNLDREIDRRLIRELLMSRVFPLLVGRQQQVFLLLLNDEDVLSAAKSLDMSISEYSQKRHYVLWRCRLLLLGRLATHFEDEEDSLS